MAIGKTNSVAGGTNTGDATALASDILSGKSAYVAEGKVDGTIPSKAAATYTPTTSDQVIASGQYLADTQTIAGDADLVASNIKSGVSIFNITGTFTDDATATAGAILSGKTGYVGGIKVTGTLATNTASNLSASGSTVTVAAGYYSSATSKNVTTGTATTPATTITVAPTISFSTTTGLITATNSGNQNVTPTVSAGYVSTGTAGTITVNGSDTYQLTTKAAATINPSTATQTIASQQYLIGTQTIRSVTTTNLTAANIKAGEVIQVGGSADGSCITQVTGTFTSDADATASYILSGKIGYVNGAKITGTVSTIAATTWNTSTANRTIIAAGRYLSGDQTQRAVTTSNLTAANIKVSTVVQVGDTGGATRIANITGTYTSDGTVTAAQMTSGKTAYVNGVKVTGTLASKAATTFNTSTADQTIASGQLLVGAQTIRAVTTAGLTAANIKAGVTATVGDASSATRIANVTGTFTSDATAAATEIKTGKIGYVNGAKITGTVADKAAATYYTSTANQTIASYQYLTGVQTIKSVKTSNITAANIKAGVVVKVGDAGNASRITQVTGTYTNDADATAALIRSGKTAYVNGTKLTGTMGDQAAKTVTPSTANITAVAAGKYTTGAINVSGSANLTAANIKKGVTLFGVTGTLGASAVSGSYTSTKQLNTKELPSSSNLTTSREWCSSVTVGDYVIFVGGERNYDGDLHYLGSGESFNSSGTKSTISTSAPGDGDTFGVSKVGNYGLIAGGYSDYAYTAYNTINAYNTSLSKTTTSLSSAKALVSGGYNTSYAIFAGGAPDDYTSTTPVATVDAYNSSLTKTVATALGAARKRMIGASTGTYAIFAGGWIASNTAQTAVYAYNTSLTRSSATALSTKQYQIYGAGTNNLFANRAIIASNGLAVTAPETYNNSLTHAVLTSLTQSYYKHADTTNYLIFTAKGQGTNDRTSEKYDTSFTKSTGPTFSSYQGDPGSGSVGGKAFFAGGYNRTGYWSLYTVQTCQEDQMLTLTFSSNPVSSTSGTIAANLAFA